LVVCSSFAVALWALLPIAARQLLGEQASGYGLLLTCIGAGAVAGAFALPSLRSRLGSERLAIAATLAYAGVLLALGLAPPFWIVCALMPFAGVAWIALLTTIHVSAQLLLPDRVRARGLAIALTVFYGSMALGSVTWGALAQRIGVSATFTATSALLLGALFAVRSFAFPTPGAGAREPSP